MERKKWKNKSFWNAFCHSLDGIKYILQNEKNIKIELVFAGFAIILGIFLKLTELEFVVLCLTIGLVLFAEMMNTVVEVMLDLYSQEYNENIKIAKDISSGAVLVISIISVVIGGLLFLSKILNN